MVQRQRRRRRTITADESVEQLRQELAAVKHELAAVTGDHYLKTAELAVVNEELRAMVEELRARNAELRQREQEQRASDAALARARTTLLGGVAHELRGPLNTILLWTHLLRDPDVQEGRWERGLDTIDRCARVEAQLVTDLLELASTHSGLAVVPTRVDATAIVHAAIEELRVHARARHIALVLSLDPELELEADGPRLQQIAWHLVAHAVKLSPEHGSVGVTLMRERAHGVLRVTYDGTGVDLALVPDLFDPSARQDATAVQRFGIGLVLVRHLVGRHGGSVETVRSAAGTSFVVRLPA